MADPTTTNATASAVNDILKTIIEGAGQGAIEAAAIADFPWLGLPIIKQLFELVLSKITGLIYQDAANAATKIVIDVQVNVEKSQVLNAFQTLQMAIASGDKNAIQQASTDLDNCYGSLIHFGGSAPA